jgi:hypothetical protein
MAEFQGRTRADLRGVGWWRCCDLRRVYCSSSVSKEGKAGVSSATCEFKCSFQACSSLFLGHGLDRFHRARVKEHRLMMILQSLLVVFSGQGLIDLPLRAWTSTAFLRIRWIWCARSASKGDQQPFAPLCLVCRLPRAQGLTRLLRLILVCALGEQRRSTSLRPRTLYKNFEFCRMSKIFSPALIPSYRIIPFLRVMAPAVHLS